MAQLDRDKGMTFRLIRKVREEAEFLRNMVRILRNVKGNDPDAEVTVADRLQQTVDRYPNNIALLDDDSTYTYAEMEEEANRYAHWAMGAGISKGDVVALIMENRPEYIFAQFGLSKVGAVVALINTNLTGAPLAHCINISEANHIVLGSELAETVMSTQDQFTIKPTIWATGGLVQGAENLDKALQQADTSRPPKSVRSGITGHDRAYYIYTSGTTGNPKAARITHHRWSNMSGAFQAAANAKPTDRMFLVLPLYHSAGGVAALGTALRSGASTVIQKKFSASNFWKDVNRYEATLFQYIGELCRYLLNAPEQPGEKTHKLRMVIGNGLRPDIWEEFVERFNIPVVSEFYGATEGNISLLNIGGKAGAIGRIPNYLAKSLPVKLVKFDVVTEEPIRGADGLCIECDVDEAGEAIGKIDPNDPKTKFEGYSDKAATDKKILRDVFQKGDCYFRSGDLLKKDADGYFYFVDRIGDTFRWKGENVATSEISEVVAAFPGIKEANVYGVAIDGQDGRAGMASIVAEGDIDFKKLAEHVTSELASYARPLFLRLSPEMEITGTFKHRKVDLVKDGFNPDTIAEPLYFYDSAECNYVPLDKSLYDNIQQGEVRV